MVSFDPDELFSTVAKMPSKCCWCDHSISLGSDITRVPDFHSLEHVRISGTWVHSSCVSLMEGYDYAMDKDD